MVTSLTVPGTQNFVAIGLGVSAPQICDFAVTFDVTSFFFVLGGGSSIRPQPTPGSLKVRRLHKGKNNVISGFMRSLVSNTLIILIDASAT